LNLVIRPYQPSDKSFIMSTMVKGMYHGCYPLSLSPRTECISIIATSLSHKLEQKLLNIKVACDSSDSDLILGYLVTTNTNSIVWAYTKNAFRKMGILNQLLEGSDINSCTNVTAIGNVIRLKKNLTFKPWEV
jgi:hypothetical protein